MNVPKLRFKEFDEEWEEKDFEELLEAKDGIRRGPFGSALKKEFFVPESDYVVYEQQNAIYDKYTTRYNITKDKYEELNKFSLKPGDFIMSGAGTIGRISKVPKGIKKGVFNQALIRFRINSEITDSEYFLQFMRAEKMQRKLTGANPGSAITNLVPMSELKKWSIITPNIKEQQKISKFLKAVDKRIQLQQQKIDLLQEQKKGFLQKMFPKAGETQPQVRFEGFIKGWIKHTLGDLGSVAMNKRIYKEETSLYGDIPFYKIGTFGGKPDAFISREKYEEYKEKYPYPNKGDLLISASGTIGRVIEYNGEEAYYQDSNIIWLQHDERLDNLFLKQFYNIVQWSGIEGTTIKRLYNKNVLETRINLPSIEEQRKIGRFLSILDNKIQLENQKMKLFQKQKQGFMQQMFI